MPPIKFSMTSINYIFELYQNELIIKDFMSGQELISFDTMDSMDLMDFLERVKSFKGK